MFLLCRGGNDAAVDNGAVLEEIPSHFGNLLLGVGLHLRQFPCLNRSGRFPENLYVSLAFLLRADIVVIVWCAVRNVSIC